MLGFCPYAYNILLCVLNIHRNVDIFAYDYVVGLPGARKLTFLSVMVCVFVCAHDNESTV